MKTSSILTSIATVAMAAPTLAAPTVEIVKLQKRSTCVLRAYWSLEIVIGGGGPGQSPVSYTSTGFDVSRDDGEVHGVDGNSISMVWQVLPASRIGSPADVSFKADFEVGSYKGCTASYMGVETQGVVGGSSGDPVGTTKAWCTMTFACD